MKDQKYILPAVRNGTNWKVRKTMAAFRPLLFHAAIKC
jgi:hypothetical protein